MAENWNKSFTHIEHRTGVIGRGGLLYLIATKSGRNLFDLWRSIYKIGAVSSRYRNRSENIVVMCEQKPCQVRVSCPRKSYPVSSENSLNNILLDRRY